MIKEREILIGNYFLDTGNKILRVDYIEDGFNNESKPDKKICMENKVNVEKSILYPDGEAHLHPYTEYFSTLRPINYTMLSSFKEPIFKGQNDDGSVLLDDYEIFCLYYDGLHFGINNRHESDDDLKTIYFEHCFPHIHKMQNIVYDITGYLLELNDNLLLKQLVNGKII